MVRRFTLLTSNPLQSIRKMDVFTTPSYFKQRLDTKRFFLAKLLGVEEAKIFIAETDSSIAFQALLTSLQEEGLVAMYGGAKAFEDYPPLCIIGLFYYLDKTIRKDFADSIEANAVHGSDSPTSAAREIAYFFETHEVLSR